MGNLTSVQNLRFFRPTSVKCQRVITSKIMSDNKEIGEKYGIHPRDVEKVKFAFDVYDFKGDGKVDGFYIGDLLRACNLNPTLHTIDEVGGMKEKGKKIMVIDDFYPIFAKVKLAKTTGGIHDFVEILKLYDKNEDGTILRKDVLQRINFLGKDVLKRRLNLHKHINYNHERVIAHFWTEFAINENLMFCCCAYSAAQQMRVRLSTQLKLNRKKMFFVIWGKGLTHHRLHNHITKNILQPFYLTSYRRFHLL